MISNQQECTKPKKSLISIYQANDQNQLTILIVYSLVVSYHGVCVSSQNKCLYSYYEK